MGARYDPRTGAALPDVMDFGALSEKASFFTGSAREAAGQYHFRGIRIRIESSGMTEVHLCFGEPVRLIM
jgi:hypothetical protein